MSQPTAFSMIPLWGSIAIRIKSASSSMDTLQRHNRSRSGQDFRSGGPSKRRAVTIADLHMEDPPLVLQCPSGFCAVESSTAGCLHSTLGFFGCSLCVLETLLAIDFVVTTPSACQILCIWFGKEMMSDADLDLGIEPEIATKLDTSLAAKFCSQICWCSCHDCSPAWRVSAS